LTKTNTAKPARYHEQELLAIIGEVYEASLDPASWPSTLARLRQLLGDSGGAARKTETHEESGPSADSLAAVKELGEGMDGPPSLPPELLAHLRRTADLHRRLSRLQLERDATLQVLNRLPLGVILLDAKGRAIICNHSAQGLLEHADALVLEADVLATTTRRHTLALHELIHDAIEGARTGNDHAGGAMMLSYPSRAQPLTLVVSPLCKPESPPSNGELAVVIFMNVPEKGVEAPNGLLGKLYGLTPAEARVTALLSQGKSLDEVAEVLGISIGTGRAHLKHVFSKTGTGRQAELVHLVLSGPFNI
jgi:DNA-binding CsgD family transcriptional regulator